MQGKIPINKPMPPKHIYYVIRMLKYLYLHVSNLYFYYIKQVIVYQSGNKEGGLVNKKERSYPHSQDFSNWCRAVEYYESKVLLN